MKTLAGSGYGKSLGSVLEVIRMVWIVGGPDGWVNTGRESKYASADMGEASSWSSSTKPWCADPDKDE
jgi:hypothetical protein